MEVQYKWNKLFYLEFTWNELCMNFPHCKFACVSSRVHVSFGPLGSGRKALADANGIQILYDSAQEVIDCREMESLILLASVIMRKCCPRNKLPLDKLQSAFTQELPESELYPTGQGVYSLPVPHRTRCV